MVEKPALSKSEMEIARILWDIGPASVREVHEAVNEERALDFTTVQTYLRRIETKGYASSRLQGRIRVYTAKTRPKTVIRQTVDDLLQRLFGGGSDATHAASHRRRQSRQCRAVGIERVN